MIKKTCFFRYLTYKIYLFFIISLFFFISFEFPATPCIASELEQSLEEIVQDFQRHIKNIQGDKKYYIVVRSFIDIYTKKPKKISIEIENTLIDKIIDRFANNKNIIVLERNSDRSARKRSGF